MFDRQPYSAAQFMNWEKDLQKSVLCNGMGTRTWVTPDGQKLVIYRDDFWKHPWTVTPLFEYDDNGDGNWVAYVEPGFVNGRNVWTFRDGQPSELFSDSPKGLPIGEWRDVLHGGLDSDGSQILHAAGEGYPLVFKSMGVKQPQVAGAGVDYGSNNDGQREIRAMDIALIVPRIAANQSVQILNPYAADEAIQIETVVNNSYVLANKETPYKLGAFGLWQPPLEPTAIDRLLGTAVEPQTDEIRLATLWALSPAGLGEDDQPDASWSIYPQYNCFWNLQHASFNMPPTDLKFKPIRFQTGLAAGVADLIIAGMLTPINDAYAALNGFLSTATFKGTFYIE